MDKITEKLNIICLSNQLWDYPLWTNKKHVMTRMAKLGHNVLFVDPPINTGRLFLRQILKKKWSIKRLVRGFYKDEGVMIYSPLDFAPTHNLLAKKHSSKINSISKKIFDKKRKTLLWVYHMEIEGLNDYIKQVSHDFLVYDCVDNYAGFPKYNTPEKKERVMSVEQSLARRANIVFTTAPYLYDRLKKFNENTFYTPNVGDFEKFRNTLKIKTLPEEIKNIPRPVIGYTGAVDEYKFDFDLFKKIVKDYPRYSFVIIGPLALKDKEASLHSLGLAGFSNVYFLGSKRYSEIQNYMAAFDEVIIPYQLNDYTVGGCFPVKFHDSLAAGFPVVVTDLPAYRPFEEVCYISKSYNEFSHNIRKALEENNILKFNQRQQVAKKNNWDGKVENMLNLIYERL